MGCHTWFYTKVKDITKEQYHNIKVKDAIHEVKELKTLTYDNYKYKKAFVDEKDFNETRQKQIQEAELFLLENKIIEGVPAYNGDRVYFNFEYNAMPYEHGGGHDAIRVYGYPEDKIHSYQELVDFLENYPKDLVEATEEGMAEMKRFWDENPDGIVDFG